MLTVTVLNQLLTGGQAAVSYSVQNGDEAEQIAAGIADAINNDTAFGTIGVVATIDDVFPVLVRVTTTSSAATTFLTTASNGDGIAFFESGTNPLAHLTVGGTVTPGDKLTTTVRNGTLPTGRIDLEYTVVSSDNTNSIAAAIADSISQDSTLAGMLHADASGNVVEIQSFSSADTLYDTAKNSGATETYDVTYPVAVQTYKYEYNQLGKMTKSVDPIGRTFEYKYAANNIDLLEARETRAGDNFFLGKWQYNTQHVPTVYIDASGERTQYAYNSFGKRVSMTDANNSTSLYATSGLTSGTVGGTVSNGKIATINVFNSALSGGSKTITYTAGTAGATDTASSVATKLAANVNADSSLTTIGVFAYVAPGSTIVRIASAAANPTTYTSSATSPMTFTVTPVMFGFPGYTRGPLGQQDFSRFVWNASGSLNTLIDSEDYAVSFQYDSLDRLLKSSYPDGTSDQVSYRALDPVISIDRNGRTTQQSYDSMDQLIFEIDPLGRKTQYSWCSCGSLSQLTDAAGHTTLWQHDLEGRVVRKVFADNTAVQYEYEPMTSRLKSRTDAIGQITTYTYNSDDTLQKIAYSGSLVNPTSDVTFQYDPSFNRMTQAKNGWGQYDYTYNAYTTDPFATASDGRGRLQQITNDVMTTTPITYEYDSLGRTKKRKINGSANTIEWTYDAMSRVTQEVNALGTFGYTYVDNGSGVSKGVTRLSSISYPNGQSTNFSWFDNSRDQRLREISNLDPSSQALSQFSYAHDPAGQITRWVQNQKGRNQSLALDYDAAGQLTGALGGKGTLPPPYGDQAFYAYDPAANRIAAETSQVQMLTVGGSKTTGDTLTVTVSDSGLSSPQGVSYTVVSADTLSTIATNLAATISATGNLANLGIDAVASGTTITLRSKSPNVTTYATSLSGSATETLSARNLNPTENITIGGMAQAGDGLQVVVHDSALSSGQTVVNYTVPSTPTLNGIATGLASNINSGTGLSTLGVTAVANGPVVTVKSTSANLTSYTGSVSGTLPTTAMTLGIVGNVTSKILIGGSATSTDVVGIAVFDSGLAGGTKTVTATVGASLNNAASALVTAINTDADMNAIGVTASASGATLTLTSVSMGSTSFVPFSKNSGGSQLGSETMRNLPANGTVTVAVSGTVVSGDSFTLKIYDAALGGGVVTKTISGQTSPAAVANALATAINTDASSPTLSATGVTASAATPGSVGVVNITSTSINATTYTLTSTGSSLASLTKSVGVSSATFNNVNELTALGAGGATRFQGTTLYPVKTLTVLPDSSTLNITHQIPNTTAYDKVVTNSSGGAGSETITLAASGANETATLGGSKTTGDILTLKFTTTAVGGTESVNYTVAAGDTNLTDVATHLTAAINADSTLKDAAIAATSSGSVITITNQTWFTESHNMGATETTTFGVGTDGSVTAAIGGTKTTGDVLNIIVHDPRLSGSQTTLSYTVLSTDSLTTIANAFVAAINADNKLALIGVTSPNGLSLSTPKDFKNSTALTLLSSAPQSATITAVNNSGTANTPNTYQLGAVGAASSTLSFDANGNMTSDGVSSFSWDAENRLVRVTYSGVNNFTEFTYDPFGRNTAIIETSAGVSTAKQFVWLGSSRSEERDISGALSKTFLADGQVNSSTKYFYGKNHLGSVVEMTDNSGAVQAEYTFEPSGRTTKLQGSADSDFQYAGYYFHARSGLNLTWYRPYSPALARWISRDPMEADEQAYSYVKNNPINQLDPLGLSAMGMNLNIDWNSFFNGKNNGSQSSSSSGGGGGGGGAAGGGGFDPPDCRERAKQLRDKDQAYKDCVADVSKTYEEIRQQLQAQKDREEADFPKCKKGKTKKPKWWIRKWEIIFTQFMKDEAAAHEDCNNRFLKKWMDFLGC